jgi:glycosyltransferase involved in cell wall biosynthesis
MAHVPGDDATPFKRWWRTRWHSQTSRFVASTASLAGRWRACGFPSGRLAIIEPGIPVHARGARAPGGTLQIAFLGPMLRRKGGREAIWTLDILLHADVPAHLHLVGEGPELDRLHLFAHALRVRQHVSFHPWTAREAVLSSIADVVWAPGDKEDEPHAALYAMSFGLPVVATAIPGLVDVIANGQTGFLVPPGDKPALARRTLQLVEDVSLRQRLGSAAQEHVRVHFTPDRMIDRYLELYDKSQPHERICPPLMADRGDGAVPGIDHGVIGQGE